MALADGQNLDYDFPIVATSTTLLSATFLLAGCAIPGAAGNAARPAYADFLSQPDRLRPVAEGDDALIWIDPSVDMASYNKFLIEHIQVHLADDAAYKAVDPTELMAMTDYLYNAIIKALNPTYKVVSKPVTTGANNYVASFSTWAYARQAFDGWAADFRKWLDGVHQR